MNKNRNFFILVFISFLFVMCNQKGKKNINQETILKGSATILVDETLTPIMEDQVAVFEGSYDAKVTIIPKSELEIVNFMFKEKSVIAVLSRNLTVEENKLFEQKKIVPKITKFATDAIAFISNKSNNDSIIELKIIIDFMKGIPNSSFKGLVFDNPNSSTVRFINNLAGIKAIPKAGVYSFKTNDEVIKFVAENKGMIGVVGVNWLSQSKPDMQDFINKINVLKVKSLTSDKYFGPSQNNIAEGKYALARDLYIINGQGYSGLGMGFASFVAGDIGQRIILKSGLLPVKIPGRRINIRKEISNDKK